jgi:hypothetical protein
MIEGGLCRESERAIGAPADVLERIARHGFLFHVASMQAQGVARERYAMYRQL